MHSAIRGRASNGPRNGVSIALIALSCAAAVAGCGSASSSYHNPHDPYGAPNVPISMSKCMRANGVSGFPDPREGPNGGGVGFPGGLMVTAGGSMVVMGIPFGGPALVHAEKVCKEYLPPGGPGATVSESQRLAAIAHAACMRKHGLPNFPDPKFDRSGGPVLQLGPGLNPQSPAVKQAAAACGLRVPS
jgi:hypothetical protein